MATLQLSSSATYCSVVQDYESRVPPTSLFGNTDIMKLPVLKYSCGCSIGYYEQANGTCVLYWSIGRVVGLVLGCIVFAVLATLIVQRVGRWYWQRRLKFNLELSQALLHETQGEVMALRRAWDIDSTEMVLTSRIDQSVEGAYGQVRGHSRC